MVYNDQDQSLSLSRGTTWHDESIDDLTTLAWIMRPGTREARSDPGSAFRGRRATYVPCVSPFPRHVHVYVYAGRSQLVL